MLSAIYPLPALYVIVCPPPARGPCPIFRLGSTYLPLIYMQLLESLSKQYSDSVQLKVFTTPAIIMRAHKRLASAIGPPPDQHQGCLQESPHSKTCFNNSQPV